MGTRADFYVNKYDRLLWIGSLFQEGDPINIPTDILIQVNPATYEEMVVDFLKDKDSAIRSDGDKWPWPWEDSRMTDYSYAFLQDRVVAYSAASNHMFDPIRVVQGDDLMDSQFPFHIRFPMMYKQARNATEEITNKYGFQPAKAV